MQFRISHMSKYVANVDFTWLENLERKESKKVRVSEGGLSSGIKVVAADWPQQLRGRWTRRNINQEMLKTMMVGRTQGVEDSRQCYCHTFTHAMVQKLASFGRVSWMFYCDMTGGGHKHQKNKTTEVFWTLFPCFCVWFITLGLVLWEVAGGLVAESWPVSGPSYSPQGVPAHRAPNPTNPIYSHICTHTKICLGACTYILYTWESELPCTEFWLVAPIMSTRSIVIFLLS